MFIRLLIHNKKPSYELVAWENSLWVDMLIRKTILPKPDRTNKHKKNPKSIKWCNLIFIVRFIKAANNKSQDKTPKMPSMVYQRIDW